MTCNRIKTTGAVFCIAFMFLGVVQQVSAQDVSKGDAAWLEKIDSMFQEGFFRVVDTVFPYSGGGPAWTDERYAGHQHASSVTLTVAAKHRTEYGMRVDLIAHIPTHAYKYRAYIAFNAQQRECGAAADARGPDARSSADEEPWPLDTPYDDIARRGAGFTPYFTPFPLTNTEFPPLYEDGLREADHNWERGDGKIIHPRDEIVESADGERLRIVERWSVRPLVEEYPEEKLLAARERGVNEATLERWRREALVSTYLDNPAYRPGVVFIDKNTGALTENREDENAEPWLVLYRTRQTWDADGKDWLYRDTISYNDRGEIQMKCVSRGPEG